MGGGGWGLKMRVSGYVPVIHSEDGLKQKPTIYTSSIKKSSKLLHYFMKILILERYMVELTTNCPPGKQNTWLAML